MTMKGSGRSEDSYRKRRGRVSIYLVKAGVGWGCLICLLHPVSPNLSETPTHRMMIM